MKRRVERRSVTDYEREEHIQTLERLGRLVVEVPQTLAINRAFVVFMVDYYQSAA